jgi:gliding motility-associated-like protein
MFDLPALMKCAGIFERVTIPAHISDVFAYQWGFGDANITDTMYISNVTSADTSHRYTSVPLGGTTKAQLVVWSEGFACSYYKKKDINMYNIEANFGFADSTVCLDADVVFGDTSLSTGATTYSWDLGNGSSFDYVSKNVPTPERYNTTGDFDVRLIINDPVSGCIDTAIKKLVILPLPQVATIDREVCRGNPAQLVASGASVYIWNDPSLTIENIDTSWTLAYPDTSTSYEVLGTDTVSNCSNKAVANIGVLQEKELVRKDTCIIIGDSVTIGTDYGSDYKYDWTEGPTQFLNCLDCPVQTIQISEEVDSILYELSYTDSLNCFPKVNEYNICVEDKYTVDVPSAFTPDGSGNNDVIYVNGHGIKELIYFRIYNRWGELIFETTDLEKGWDGIYKGNAQGIETFVYQAKVKFYNDQFETKGGDITLIR